MKLLLSSETKVSPAEQLKELQELAKRPTDDEEQNRALRWMIHQPQYPESLRLAIAKVLIDWRAKWLVEDLTAMIADLAQPEGWRKASVLLLAEHHELNLDAESYEALKGAAQAKPLAIRDTALAALARLCRAWNWIVSNPEKYEFVSGLVAAALKSGERSTLVEALTAVAIAGMEKRIAEAEAFALDPKAAPEIRAAALQAVGAIPRAQALQVLEVCLKEPEERVRKAAEEVRPYVLAAQLGHPETAVRERIFKELSTLGPAAYRALERIMSRDDHLERQELAKTILGQSILKDQALPPIDLSALKPLGQDPKKNEKGVKEILLDPKSRIIAVEGEFCLQAGPLEYAVVCKGENAKLHETAAALHASPMNICYALLACAYTYVGEYREGKEVNLPKGAGVVISIEFEQETRTPQGTEKKRIRLPLESFIWNSQAGRPMKRVPWAFTGSRTEKGPDGRPVMVAEITRSLIAIKPDPDAVLNSLLDTAALADVNPDKGAYYEMNRALAPKPQTKLLLIFEPWTADESKPQDFSDKPNISDAAATQPRSGGKTPE